MRMVPTEEERREMAFMHTRAPDGNITRTKKGHPQRRPLIARTKEEVDTIFHSGGGGLFGRPNEYVEILAVILNDGVHPRTGNRLLKKETVDKMFNPSLPEEPGFENGFKVTKPDGMSPEGIPQGFGLGFSLQLGDSSAHRKGTGFGGGLPSLSWWADREEGIGGFGVAQIIPIN
ncbi:hypothetical protein RBB50_003913 [Rhinocladiella similis]